MTAFKWNYLKAWGLVAASVLCGWGADRSTPPSGVRPHALFDSIQDEQTLGYLLFRNSRKM